MRRLSHLILLFSMLSCSKDKIAPTYNYSTTLDASSATTRWKVSELVQGGFPLISVGDAASNYIYLELRYTGQYLADNGVNDCYGRFTTDNNSEIDFYDNISCTKVKGDMISYQQFKETLTKQVATYKVNSDSTVLTLLYNSETYIKLLRLR